MKKTVITLRVSAEEAEYMRRSASGEHRSVNQWLRLLVARYGERLTEVKR